MPRIIALVKTDFQDNSGLRFSRKRILFQVFKLLSPPTSQFLPRSPGSIAVAVLSALLACSHASWAEDGGDIEEILVETRRLPDAPTLAVFSSMTIGGDQITGAPSNLDDVLRRVPGFGLFRRQTSRASHPTTQGVSLRGLGPNGAGRTLVLLDGVPLNDPFGGWVEWVHLPPASIAQATVVRGGGAGPWGNSALAGVVRLDSGGNETGGVTADARGGSRESFSGYASAALGAQPTAFRVSAHFSDSDGYFLLSPEQRGLADRRAARRSYGARASLQHEAPNGTIWSAVFGAAADRFTNGSDVAGADTETYDAALSAVNQTPSSGPAWESHVYLRRKNFESVFGAFDDARETVRPVLDQFDVPATALGANAVLRWSDVPNWTIEGGADVRFADGETNERFRNLGAGFTRQRHAGGEQVIAGAFVEGYWQATPKTALSIGARADHWRQSGGVRREQDLQSNAILVDTRFPSRSGVSVNGRAALSTQVTSSLGMRAAAYSGFRVPTLNELYRPFRVGNDITEANAALKTERLAGAEVGVQWQDDVGSVQLTLFRNDLFDPIANTTVTTTPGFNVEFGVFIPPGGSLRQRRNLDRVRTWGVEADATADLSDIFSVRAGYLFTDPKVKRSSVSPVLEGNRLAQVAKHQASVGVSMKPVPKFTLDVDLIGSTRQFEDDLNQRVLSGAVTMDIHAAYALTPSVEFYAAAENLFDTRVEAGRSANGLVTLGPPVFLWLGLRLAY